MNEKRTSFFENGLIWFGAGVSIAEILDSEKEFWRLLLVIS